LPVRLPLPARRFQLSLAVATRRGQQRGCFECAGKRASEARARQCAAPTTPRARAMRQMSRHAMICCCHAITRAIFRLMIFCLLRHIFHFIDIFAASFHYFRHVISFFFAFDTPLPPLFISLLSITLADFPRLRCRYVIADITFAYDTLQRPSSLLRERVILLALMPFCRSRRHFASFALMFSPPRISLPATFSRDFRLPPPMPCFRCHAIFLQPIIFFRRLRFFFAARHFDAIFIFARRACRYCRFDYAAISRYFLLFSLMLTLRPRRAAGVIFDAPRHAIFAASPMIFIIIFITAI
jgi:hypothetical protein